MYKISEENMRNFEVVQRMLFEDFFYENGNIEKFVQELKEFDTRTISDNCKDEKWISFAGRQIGRLELIALLLKSKKIEKQREDLKPLGKYIQELGKEIEEYEI